MQQLHAPAARRPNYGLRAKLGMMFPAGNTVAEPQMSAMLPDGVSLHVTRLMLQPSNLRGMLDRLEEATALLADARVDRLLFHCTAVSMISAELVAEVRSRIAAVTDIPVVITSDAVQHALEAFGATKIVLVSPYEQSTNEMEVRFLRGAGITVLRERGLALEPRLYGTYTPEQWFAETVAMRDPDADAYFISCTAIQSADAVDALERELGRPVITSNQVAIWRALRTAGIEDRIEGYGRLLREN
jgi:maleate isomerase